MSDDGKLGRRAFLGAAAAGVAAAVAACSSEEKPAAGNGTARAAATPRRAAPLAENALPGDPHWVVRHLGAEHEIEGYAGKIGVGGGGIVPVVRLVHLLRLPGDRVPAGLVPG